MKHGGSWGFRCFLGAPNVRKGHRSAKQCCFKTNLHWNVKVIVFHAEYIRPKLFSCMYVKLVTTVYLIYKNWFSRSLTYLLPSGSRHHSICRLVSAGITFPFHRKHLFPSGVLRKAEITLVPTECFLTALAIPCAF